MTNPSSIHSGGREPTPTYYSLAPTHMQLHHTQTQPFSRPVTYRTSLINTAEESQTITREILELRHFRKHFFLASLLHSIIILTLPTPHSMGNRQRGKKPKQVSAVLHTAPPTQLLSCTTVAYCCGSSGWYSLLSEITSLAGPELTRCCWVPTVHR